MILSATEGCSTGAYHSLGSLVNPSRGGKSKRSWNSEPFIKPALKKHQQLDFSLEDSRWFLKALAAELDRIVQLKDKTIESGVNTGEIKEEDGQTLILEWADEIQSLQQKNKQKPMKDFNRLNFREEHKVVIKDLYKQWKKGQLVSILPVMDFTIRTMLLEDKCEESMFKSWFKTEQKFKKAGDMHVPDQVRSEGVYLDVEEGQLSFYDTEKRKHIYTFKADFSMSGKIYPVFGTVETGKPLKIM